MTPNLLTCTKSDYAALDDIGTKPTSNRQLQNYYLLNSELANGAD